MKANEFIKRILAKVSMLSTGDIPIKLNGQDINCVIELIENGKGYYINIKQLTKDPVLTWKDIAFIYQTCTEVTNSLSNKSCAYTLGFKDLYWEVLRRFNEQRKK